MISTERYEARKRLVETARSILAGNLSAIEGAQLIVSGGRLAGLDEFDEDYIPFIAVMSETDRFPIGRVRQYWNPQALEMLQPEIDEAERWAKEFAASHCQKLVDRFGPTAIRHEIACIARDMLAGSASFLQGAHHIALLRAYADLPESDTNLAAFIRVHVKYPSLPPTDGREYWASDLLQAKFPEIPRAESEARQMLTVHCQSLVERFIG